MSVRGREAARRRRRLVPVPPPVDAGEGNGGWLIRPQRAALQCACSWGQLLAAGSRFRFVVSKVDEGAEVSFRIGVASSCELEGASTVELQESPGRPPLVEAVLGGHLRAGPVNRGPTATEDLTAF